MQPYVPAYRIAFFESLISSLAADGIDLTIAAGSPDRIQGSRGDSVSPHWLTQVNTNSLQIGSRSVDLSINRKVWGDSDAVIMGLVGSSVDTNLAVLQSIRGKRKVGLWGHVKSYVSEPNRLDASVERWQMRHADHIFAYTNIGADFAERLGVPKSRITAVINTIDTPSLEHAKETVTNLEVESFERHHGLVPGKVFAFVGSIDGPKRIRFLADFLEALHLIAPEIKVLIGGQGSQVALFDRAVARRQAILLGQVGDSAKAIIGRSASALVCPGRIGLVAVEALVLGLPVLTTHWPYHAPEVEYLVEGDSRLTGPDDPSEFAAFACSALQTLEGEAWRNPIWGYPTLDCMVTNFRNGMVSMLNSSSN